MIRSGYVLMIVVLLFAVGCQKKQFNSVDPVEEPKSIENLEIKPDFNWKLTRNVNFTIVSQEEAIVEITSLDYEILYHKGKVSGNSVYEINISFPANLERVLVNGKEISVSGDMVSLELNEDTNLKGTSGTTTYVMHFDGNDYIYIDDADLSGSIPAASSGAAEDFTISTWVYLKGSTGRRPIVSKQGTTEAGVQRGFMLSATDGGLEFQVFKSDGGSDKTDLFSPSGQMSLNTWYHVAATYEYVADGSSKMNLYIDGVEVASTNTAVGPVQPNSQPLEVGRYYWSGSYSKYFYGYLEDFRMYSTARTEAEIAGDRATIVPTGSANLELNWLFEEGPGGSTGVTTADKTSNGNDGNIMGCLYSSTTVPYIITDTDSDGVPDDDDDYPNDPDRAFDNYFPAAGHGSLAYEDLWPGKGDYDFNDIVVDYRFHTVTNASNDVVEIFASFPVKASGAYLQNGFGFNLPDASTDFEGNPQKLTVSGYDIQESYITLNAYGHEDGQTKPTIIVFDRMFNLLPPPGGGTGVNTDPDYTFVEFDTVNITLIPSGTFEMNDFSLNTWNPFIIVDMQRGHEVHLPDYPGTDLMNTALYGQWEDDTDPLSGRYFKNENNLPWAIDIPSSFEWPKERVEVTSAYLHFAEWAESSGTLYDDWYEDLAGYRNDANIYEVP